MPLPGSIDKASNWTDKVAVLNIQNWVCHSSNGKITITEM